jgi:hypothetical protein
MSRRADVVHHDRSTNFAGIVDNDVAETHDPLRNARGNGDVLDFAERNVASSARHQSPVDLEFGIGHCVTNHVSLEVVIGRNQKQRQRQQDGNVSRNADVRQQEHQRDTTKHRQSVTRFNKNHGWANGENNVLKIVVVGAFQAISLHPGDASGFGIVRRGATI